MGLPNPSSASLGHARAVATEAGCLYRDYLTSSHGIDGQIEYCPRGGQTAYRVFLQTRLKRHYSLRVRSDGSKLLSIREPSDADYWLLQTAPVMLTFQSGDNAVCWMDITAIL